MTDAMRRFVANRAGGCCEYCHLPQTGHEERFSIDHIVALKHLVNDDPENLAFCCLRCNLHKGTNLSGLDPADLSVALLFHPRRQVWSDHFTWNGAVAVGLTPIGRATIATLQMNAPERARLRAMLIAEGIPLRG